MNSTRDGLARDHRVQLVHMEPRSLRKLYSRVRNCNTSRNRKQNKKVNAKLRVLPAVIGVLLHEDTNASQRAALGILLLQCWSCGHVSDRQNPRRCFFLTNAKANSHKLQRSHLASWLCMGNALSHSSTVTPPKPATGTMCCKPTNEARRSYGRHAQAAGHSDSGTGLVTIRECERRHAAAQGEKLRGRVRAPTLPRYRCCTGTRGCDCDAGRGAGKTWHPPPATSVPFGSNASASRKS